MTRRMRPLYCEVCRMYRNGVLICKFEPRMVQLMSKETTPNRRGIKSIPGPRD